MPPSLPLGSFYWSDFFHPVLPVEILFVFLSPAQTPFFLDLLSQNKLLLLSVLFVVVKVLYLIKLNCLHISLSH